MIFFPFPTDSVDDAQVSSKKVMSPDHPIVNYSFALSIANLIVKKEKNLTWIDRRLVFINLM